MRRFPKNATKRNVYNSKSIGDLCGMKWMVDIVKAGIAVAIVCLSGCQATEANFIPSGGGAMQPWRRSPYDVIVIMNGEPQYRYTKVGSLIISQKKGRDGESLMWFVEAFKKNAAAAGADGVMNLSVVRGSMSGAGMGFGGISLAQSEQKIMEMTADAFVWQTPPSGSPSGTPGAAGRSALPADRVTPDDTFDMVLLTNGGRLRGIVFEEDPQTGVGIKLPNGATRRLKSVEVKQVIYHSR